MKSFFYHYNKPASNKAGKPVISLHFSGKCHLIDNIIVNVPSKGKIRAQQPHFVMVGRANEIKIEGGIAYIY